MKWPSCDAITCRMNSSRCSRPMQFDGTIAVQARQMVEETEWLLELSDQHAFIQGVVGWVDLRSPELARDNWRSTPRTQSSSASATSFTTNRMTDFMLLPEFRRGIAQLREFDLTYDLLLFPQHLPVAVATRHRVSEPALRARPHRQARHSRATGVAVAGRSAAAGGASPTCSANSPGMVTEAEWQQWRPEDFHPLPRRRHRGLRHRARDDRFRLAGLHAVRRLRLHDARRRGLLFSSSPRKIGDDILGSNCARFYHLDEQQRNTMSKTMLAAVLHGIQDLRVERTSPSPNSNPARCSCACGAPASAAPTCITSRRAASASFAVTAPFILGHEVTGEVVAVARRRDAARRGPARGGESRHASAGIATTAAAAGAISAATCGCWAAPAPSRPPTARSANICRRRRAMFPRRHRRSTTASAP